jgi:uncharacterized protein (DUF1697 family)
MVKTDPKPARSVAFLRAVNVAGRRVKRGQLIDVLSGLGLDRVETFLASGNVLYEPDAVITDPDIERALEAALGFNVEVTSRRADELDALAHADPFPQEAVAASLAGPQVMFLFEAATPAVRAAVAQAGSDDQFVFGDRELYWLPRDGVADSDMRAIHRAVGPNTIRTIRTIRRLHEKL